MKLQTKSVARALNVTPDRVRQMEREGKLPAEKTSSGTRLFESSDVQELKEERAAKKKGR